MRFAASPQPQVQLDKLTSDFVAEVTPEMRHKIAQNNTDVSQRLQVELPIWSCRMYNMAIDYKVGPASCLWSMDCVWVPWRMGTLWGFCGFLWPMAGCASTQLTSWTVAVRLLALVPARMMCD